MDLKQQLMPGKKPLARQKLRQARSNLARAAEQMAPPLRKSQEHMDSTLKKERLLTELLEGPVVTQKLTTASSASLVSCHQWGPSIATSAWQCQRAR